ncbi:DUF2336 domain-containing protein [Sphingobium sp.]|uniref:DUF2336 domain-containing protein n=1 Tax=Sphingobium sp. TaxID=1912891 RepID=UPI003BB61901
MSVYSSLHGAALADNWPMAQRLAGLSAVPVSHAIDLAFFFPLDGHARHDALIAETRRHLGGCLNAIELALRASLDHVPDIAAALDASPDAICWPTVRAQPTLLGSALLAHMQMRAGVSLMLRQYGHPHADSVAEAEPEALLPVDDPTFGGAAAALVLAEGRWAVAGGDDQPMRPDLPAEYFAELVWTAAACLAARAQRTMPDDGDALLAAFERSGWALLADHDESASPIAEADRLIRRLGELSDSPELLGAALDQRRFLLFAALTARRLRMTMMQVTEILTMGPLPHVATLCRALGGSDADYRHLLLSLRPVRPCLTDAAIVTLADHYQQLSDIQADCAISGLRTPAAFRAKLDHLRVMTGEARKA